MNNMLKTNGTINTLSPLVDESGVGLLFALLQVALGRRDRLGVIPTDDIWEKILAVAKKQSLVGVCFVGLQRLPIEERPNRRMIGRWMILADKLVAKNEKVTCECRTVVEMLREQGYDSCILKGQALHEYYPENMCRYRTPGDVDVWLKPFDEDGKTSKGRKLTNDERMAIIRYACETSGEGELPIYHHIHCEGMLKDNLTELHFTPSYSINPFDNGRLQNFFNAEWMYRRECGYGFKVLSWKMNLVFMLSHIQRHVITEGIGLRQLLDYYMVLTSDKAECSREEVMEIIEYVGMKKLCGAVMYILRLVFRMDSSYLLCKPDKMRGHELLLDILEGGNFGQYNARVKGIYSGSSNLIRFYRAQKSSLRLFRSYPREVFWVPWSNVITSIKKNYWRKRLAK